MISIYILVENNTPIYLGKTNEPNRRMKEHRRIFSTDVYMEIIDEVEDDKWVFWERWWIGMFKCWGINLLNKNVGGGGPSQHTEYSKKLIQNKLKGQEITWDLGTSTAVLQFDKSGNFISEYKSMGEAASKTGVFSGGICAVCKNKRRSAGGYIWVYKETWDNTPPVLRPHKSKGKEGITKGKNWKRKNNPKRNDLTKCVLQFDKYGKFLQEFNSIREAANFLKISEAIISHCCRGKSKTAFGFIWKYKE